MVTAYPFKGRVYTEQEVRETGFRHGRDGLREYPPRCWGFDDDEECLMSHPADSAYMEGYEAGRSERAER